MKNGSGVLIFICALSICLVIGIFVGRNLNDDYVPLPESDAEEAVVVPAETKNYRLDINTASMTQLMELPGIGETIAERIVDYREEKGGFSTTDELLNVEGIGEKKLLQIEELIKVGG